MAGNKMIFGRTEATGDMTGGLPLVTIVENGNVEEGDEWALFRLSNDGLSFYNEGAEFRENIMQLIISGKPAVVELSPHHKTRDEATIAWKKLSDTEKARTLIRSVRPETE